MWLGYCRHLYALTSFQLPVPAGSSCSGTVFTRDACEFIWKLNYFVSTVARWIHELHYLSHYVKEMTPLNASAIHLWCHFVASDCAFTSVIITWRRLYQTLKFLRFLSVLYTSHYTTPFASDTDFLTGEGTGNINKHDSAGVTKGKDIQSPP